MSFSDEAQATTLEPSSETARAGKGKGDMAHIGIYWACWVGYLTQATEPNSVRKRGDYAETGILIGEKQRGMSWRAASGRVEAT